jgi:tRNA G18 (ribose-2'-O)-methylase SpoU
LAAGLEEGLLLAGLKQRKIEIYALMPGGHLDVAQADFNKPSALIVGSEGRGVGERLHGQSTDVRIPTVGVESLNAALAVGIVLYEARRQRMARQ